MRSNPKRFDFSFFFDLESQQTGIALEDFWSDGTWAGNGWGNGDDNHFSSGDNHDPESFQDNIGVGEGVLTHIMIRVLYVPSDQESQHRRSDERIHAGPGSRRDQKTSGSGRWRGEELAIAPIGLV